MKKTLETFIDPANIPKKYGGQLDFQFGDMPVPDPAWKDVMTWEGNYKEFPTGPLYWVPSDDKKGMKALAVGSNHESERRDTVCVLEKPGNKNNEVNGNSTAAAPAATSQSTDSKQEASPAVQEGEPTSLATAQEGLSDLTLNEKSADITPGSSEGSAQNGTPEISDAMKEKLEEAELERS
jgi:hypothetical protein